MKKRIWELDVFRGIGLLIMIGIHIAYDLMELFRVIPEDGLWFFSQGWAGVLFLLLSGLCATMGHHPIRRGLTVLGCGCVVTAATAGMYLLGWADRGIMIYFGILHCLGVCMLLWPLLKKLPPWADLLLGAALIALGSLLTRPIAGSTWLLVPLGLYPPDFATSDYYPLLPYLGYFLIGAFLGKTLYKNRVSLLPEAWNRLLPCRMLGFLGRHSLTVYMLHQPVLYAGIAAILYITGRIHI